MHKPQRATAQPTARHWSPQLPNDNEVLGATQPAFGQPAQNITRRQVKEVLQLFAIGKLDTLETRHPLFYFIPSMFKNKSAMLVDQTFIFAIMLFRGVLRSPAPITLNVTSTSPTYQATLKICGIEMAVTRTHTDPSMQIAIDQGWLVDQRNGKYILHKDFICQNNSNAQKNEYSIGWIVRSCRSAFFPKFQGLVMQNEEFSIGPRNTSSRLDGNPCIMVQSNAGTFRISHGAFKNGLADGKHKVRLSRETTCICAFNDGVLDTKNPAKIVTYLHQSNGDIVELIYSGKCDANFAPSENGELVRKKNADIERIYKGRFLGTTYPQRGILLFFAANGTKSDVYNGEFDTQTGDMHGLGALDLNSQVSEERFQLSGVFNKDHLSGDGEFVYTPSVADTTAAQSTHTLKQSGIRVKGKIITHTTQPNIKTIEFDSKSTINLHGTNYTGGFKLEQKSRPMLDLKGSIRSYIFSETITISLANGIIYTSSRVDTQPFILENIKSLNVRCGTFVDGKLNGEAEIIFGGTVFKGTFNPTENITTGVATFANGATFTATFDGSSLTATEKQLTYPNDDAIYLGEFDPITGATSGIGKLVIIYGDTYSGNFTGGKFPIHGSIDFSNGQNYIGAIDPGTGNMLNGSLTYTNGSTFIGQFNSNNRPLSGKFVINNSLEINNCTVAIDAELNIVVTSQDGNTIYKNDGTTDAWSVTSKNGKWSYVGKLSNSEPANGSLTFDSGVTVSGDFVFAQSAVTCSDAKINIYAQTIDGAKFELDLDTHKSTITVTKEGKDKTIAVERAPQADTVAATRQELWSVTTPNGDRYVGEMSGGKQNGMGEFTPATGSWCYKGKFADNKMVQGTFVSASLKVTGSFTRTTTAIICNNAHILFTSSSRDDTVNSDLSSCKFTYQLETGAIEIKHNDTSGTIKYANDSTSNSWRVEYHDGSHYIGTLTPDGGQQNGTLTSPTENIRNILNGIFQDSAPQAVATSAPPQQAVARQPQNTSIHSHDPYAAVVIPGLQLLSSSSSQQTGFSEPIPYSLPAELLTFSSQPTQQREVPRPSYMRTPVSTVLQPSASVGTPATTTPVNGEQYHDTQTGILYQFHEDQWYQRVDAADGTHYYGSLDARSYYYPNGNLGYYYFHSDGQEYYYLNDGNGYYHRYPNQEWSYYAQQPQQ